MLPYAGGSSTVSAPPSSSPASSCCTTLTGRSCGPPAAPCLRSQALNPPTELAPSSVVARLSGRFAGIPPLCVRPCPCWRAHALGAIAPPRPVAILLGVPGRDADVTLGGTMKGSAARSWSLSAEPTSGCGSSVRSGFSLMWLRWFARRRFQNQNRKPARTTITKTSAPTTPPTIAPMLLLL